MPPEERLPRPEWLEPQPPGPFLGEPRRSGGPRYVLGPVLGQGGGGEVLEAWDQVLHRMVALKVLKKMDPASLLRFMHEARTQSRVVHPCICQIYDVDSTEGAPRIAMQLVRGPNLAEAAAVLTQAEIVRILARVADAVQAAHDLNLIHRDLKPSNILLERDGEGGWSPYVCDFGLALDLDDPTITATHQVQGTPAFMAPEQVHGERARIGPATDVYALGGTLRFALRGGLEPRAPKPPEAGPAAQDLELITRKCLESDPERRYPTAAALAEELWRVSRGEPIAARAPGALAGHWRLRRRAWLRSLAAALACGGLAAGLVLAQRRLAAAGQRSAEWARYYVQAAADLDQALRLEQVLPGHDLRPAQGRLRARLQAIQARMPAQGPEAQGPAHFALGRGRLLLGDPGGAQAELDLAWDLGFRAPEVAQALACARAVAHGQAERERQYLEPSGRPEAAAAGPVAALLQLGVRPGTEADPCGTALVWQLRGDFAKAAAAAHAGLGREPWRGELAALEAASLAALGRQAEQAGDPLLAEARFSSALDTAGDFLATAPSQVAVHHARLQAARDLAALELDQGRPALGFLERWQRLADRALGLDPGDPALQDDWLHLRFLKARCLAGLGRDPGPELEAARAFLGGLRPPLTAELRAERMLIHWQLAERAFRAGADPGPELAQALKDPGHTPFFGRDYLWQVLAFQAQAGAARGQDPRPALAALRARMAQRPGAAGGDPAHRR